MPIAEGEVFAGYTIVRSLGAGGMGEVYLAQHPRLPRCDALKVLPNSVSADDEYRQRFHREADIAATLWHPHIVSVHDRGESDGQLWISMDYVEGTDGAALLEQRFRHGLPPTDVVRIVTAVGEALDYAHERQLLHRDVKPANILLADSDSNDGRVLLADFGIARRIYDTSNLTGTNMTLGTVAYAAPEQLMGGPIDGRADQYALAATTFHLLTGTPLFAHSNPAVVISQHLTSEPPAIESRRPELSAVGPVLAKALAKAPADRYARCLDFARALEHRIGTAEQGPDDADATTAVPVSLAGKHRKRPSAQRRSTWRRSPVVVALFVALVTAAVVSTGFLMLHRPRPSTAHPQMASTQPRLPSPPPAPAPSALPVVAVGADCSILGTAGIASDGRPAYCAHLATINATIWSHYPGEVASPTASPDPSDAASAPATESPVLVCIEQTGQTSLKCHEAIRQEKLATESGGR